MTNAFFHNFTDETFTGYWNGKPKTFKPGDRLLMPAWLAEHFAKHLTNRELIKVGKDTYTSPKNPGQMPEFMNIFKKCYIPEGKTGSESEIDDIISSSAVPSMDITVEKPKPIEQGPAAALAEQSADDLYDASKAPQVGPGSESTIISVPDEEGDESSFDTAAKA
jgi:hypothetical protein